jgi:hypothetical protein
MRRSGEVDILVSIELIWANDDVVAEELTTSGSFFELMGTMLR